MCYYDFDLQGCLDPMRENTAIIRHLFAYHPNAYYRASASRNGNLHVITDRPDPFLSRYQDRHFEQYIFFNNKGPNWAEGSWHNLRTGDKEDDLFLMPTICLCLYETYETRERVDSEDYGDQEIHHDLLFTDKWDYETLKTIYTSGHLRFCFVSLLRLVPETVWPFRVFREVSSRFEPDHWQFSVENYGLCLEAIEEAYQKFVRSIPPDHNPANHINQLLEKGKSPKIPITNSIYSILL